MASGVNVAVIALLLPVAALFLIADTHRVHKVVSIFPQGKEMTESWHRFTQRGRRSGISGHPR